MTAMVGSQHRGRRTTAPCAWLPASAAGGKLWHIGLLWRLSGPLAGMFLGDPSNYRGTEAGRSYFRLRRTVLMRSPPCGLGLAPVFASQGAGRMGVA